MVPREDHRIGRVVDGRFRLVEVLGSGGMGVVYRAEHLLLQQEVALKLLHTHLHHHPRGMELKQRFLREARSLARLGRQHPHITPIIDCGVCDDGTLYMAMELLQGEPLCHVIARGPLPPARALDITAQVLRTLIHAHGKGIVHRDLKPDNIMLTRHEGRADFVKVLDFGIAKLLSEAEIPTSISAEEAARELAEGPAQPLTRAGIIFGTPEYLSPEQAQGLPVDQRTDLYAVGVLLWEMLTGRRPFVGTSPLEVVSLHLTAPPDPPSLHCPVPLPPALDQLVLRAMAKDPAERFATAEEFLRALDVVLDQLGRDGTTGLVRLPRLGRWWWRPQVPARRPGPWQAVSRWLGVRGAAAVAAGAMLGGLLALAALLAHLLHAGARPPPPTSPPVAAPAPKATPPPVAEPPPQVPLQDLLEGLERGRSCQERRSAALALMARGDVQALPALERARRRALGRRAPNACMRQELEEAIEQLRSGTRGAHLPP
ncbi:MAG: serine/threonine-protein kinase [Myxococcales bacterium]|nr:serine/threonine protein kinase [Myxococcota bacterium]MDW8283044.1 serine/threonine-protein kinase [Myxococcales bacterium]